MSLNFPRLLSPQPHPALGILRIAALSAGSGSGLDEETLALMTQQVSAGVLNNIAPAELWLELAVGLMAQTPSNMFSALHNCGALKIVLPEIAALFGVYQIANDPPQVDIGGHLLRVLDETARSKAPMPVRFAALVMNVGKSDSPPEHLPVHYRHIERGHIRIDALCERLGVPEDCRDMAILALDECERVHRVSEVRAGPVAAMLERLGAFSDRARFEQLMLLCTCDYCAYPGFSGRDYPKAALLEIALMACENLEASDVASESLQDARAEAVAAVFHSERWSGGRPHHVKLH